MSCVMAAPPPPPPPHKEHKDHKNPPPPPPPPEPYVVYTSQEISDIPANNCDRHFLRLVRTTLHYSDNSTSSSGKYTAYDAYGNPVLTDFLDIEHYINNNNHYFVGKYLNTELFGSTYKYMIVNADRSTGKERIYSTLTMLENNRFLVKDGSYKGIVDFDNNEIVPIKYKALDKISNRVYKTKMNGSYGLITIDGDIIIPCNCEKFSKMGTYYKVKRNDKWGVVDSDGNVIAQIIYKKVKLQNNQVYVSKDGSNWMRVTLNTKY